MIYLFLMPIETKAWSVFKLARVPKYLVRTDRFSVVDYGWEPVGLVCLDTDATGAATLAAYPDVIKIPDNLDDEVGDRLAAVRTKLRAVNIPAKWVVESTTYREAIRVVVAVFHLMQRLKEHADVAERLFSGNALSTVWSDVPAIWRTRILAGLAKAGISTEGLDASMTIEEALEALLVRFKNTPVNIGLVSV